MFFWFVFNISYFWSAGSVTSTSSHDSESQTLHAGVCLNAVCVSAKDAAIAREAFELLVACLQLRTHNLGKLSSHAKLMVPMYNL